jgi:hypothetical protein
MSSENTNPSQMPPKNPKQPKGKKNIKFSFNLSWIYGLLLLGIVWMFFNQGGANPQKVEWDEVKQMVLDCDVKQINFVRNDFEGRLTIKPEKLEKYSSKFGGVVPQKSPHFFFLVSGSFNAE